MQLLGLARRAGALTHRRTEAVRQAVRAGEARVVLFAGDASPAQLDKIERTLKELPRSDGESGGSGDVGRVAVGLAPLSAVAVTDAPLAEQVVAELGDPARGRLGSLWRGRKRICRSSSLADDLKVETEVLIALVAADGDSRLRRGREHHRWPDGEGSGQGRARASRGPQGSVRGHSQPALEEAAPASGKRRRQASQGGRRAPEPRRQKARAEEEVRRRSRAGQPRPRPAGRGRIRRSPRDGRGARGRSCRARAGRRRGQRTRRPAEVVADRGAGARNPSPSRRWRKSRRRGPRGARAGAAEARRGRRPPKPTSGTRARGCPGRPRADDPEAGPGPRRERGPRRAGGGSRPKDTRRTAAVKRREKGKKGKKRQGVDQDEVQSNIQRVMAELKGGGGKKRRRKGQKLSAEEQEAQEEQERRGGGAAERTTVRVNEFLTVAELGRADGRAFDRHHRLGVQESRACS